MAFTRPTLQQIIDRIENDIKTRMSSTTLLRRSVLAIIARVLAGAIHLLYGFVVFTSEQLFASTADGAGLDLIASEYNLDRNAAVKATGNATATGTPGPGVFIPAGTELQSDEGVKYTVDSNVVLSGGVGTLSLTAIIAGDDGNESASVVLTFVSPIVGIDSIVTIDSDGITGGSDEETDELLRARILRRKQLPPKGGAEFDYENWALEVSGVTRAWAIAQYYGDGTVGVIFVRDNDNSIIPDSTEIATVRSYLVEHTDPASGETVGIPIGAEPGLIMIAPELLVINLEINISPNTAAVQTAIENEISDVILRDGGPEQSVRLSRISEAISSATNESHHTLVSPIVDITANANQVHTLGTITFGDY